ncbi:MAG: glycosyltransferase [Alphaproteobacteria bacterium]|nr:glycosyltransferase [Alphaproteobacteria bacterium]
MSEVGLLSVIIPALEAESVLADTVAALRAGAGRLRLDVTVVDGGSLDGTRSLAASLGARVMRVEKGRGQQLAAGAASAAGSWLLFLHADTRLGPTWGTCVEAFGSDGANHDRFAAFRLAFDDQTPGARRLEQIVAWRCKTLGLPFGDQGLLIARRRYEEIGGFQPLVLMEDVDLVRRLDRRRCAMLDATATTSAARYRSDGYLRRSARNLVCLGLYFAGVSPRLLARLYG